MLILLIFVLAVTSVCFLMLKISEGGRQSQEFKNIEAQNRCPIFCIRGAVVGVVWNKRILAADQHS